MPNEENDIYKFMNSLTEEESFTLLEDFQIEYETLSEVQKKKMKSNVLSKINKQNQNPKRNAIKKGILAACITGAVLCFTLSSSKTMAVILDAKSKVVSTINNFFAPSKIITQNLEGTPSKIKVHLNDNHKNYAIYIDKTMYTLKHLEEKDVIIPKQVSKQLPEVSMTIEQILNKKPKAILAEIKNNLKSQYTTVTNPQRVIIPVNGILLQASNGNKWNDALSNCYLVDNQKGGTFIITEKYFFGAEEGHGTRFKNMLKEFKIIK